MRRQRALSPIVLGAEPVAALPAYLNFGNIALPTHPKNRETRDEFDQNQE